MVSVLSMVQQSLDAKSADLSGKFADVGIGRTHLHLGAHMAQPCGLKSIQ